MSRTQFAVVLLVVAVSGFLGGAVSDRLKGRPAYAQSGVPELLRAQGFQLVDATGRERGAFATTEGGVAFLNLLNHEGKQCAMLAVEKDSSYVAVGDNRGERRATLEVRDNGGAWLLVEAPEGKSRVYMAADPDGLTAVHLCGENGVPRAALEVSPDGTPLLVARDSTGKNRVSLAPADDGTAYIGLAQANGDVRLLLSADDRSSGLALLTGDKRQAALEATTDGLAALTIQALQGKSNVSLRLEPGGDQSLHLCDQAGMPRAGIEVLPDGSPTLIACDSEGRGRAGLGVTEGDEPALVLLDSTNGLRAALKLVEGESPLLLMQGRGDKPGLAIGVRKDDDPTITTWDKNGEETTLAPGGAAHAPDLPRLKVGTTLTIAGSDDQKYRLLMQDGSWWQVNPAYWLDMVAFYRTGSEVLLLQGTNRDWPYKLVDADSGKIIEARPAPPD